MIRRRAFVRGLAAVGVSALGARHADAEPPPETTRLRLALSPAVCFAPQFVAHDLLLAEGFTAIEYVEAPEG